MLSSEPWTEAAVHALAVDEYDFQEFKGSAWLCYRGEVSPDFANNFSKQLSAFANGAGGRLFIGLADDGTIDGGVPIELKRGGIRSWLEDVAVDLLDPPLAGFSVHEVLAGSEDSPIKPGHGVYVIEVSSSEAAPHQALDHRYYLRIAGKSRPMGHVHIQDILRRTVHPRVHVRRLAPYGPEERVTTDRRGPKVQIAFRMFLRNHGRRLARHVGAEVILPRPLVNADVRTRTASEQDVSITQRPGTVNFFRYHPHPLFPGQDIYFLQFWVSLHRGNLDAVASGMANVRWKVYADDAIAREGTQPLSEFAVVRQGLQWLRDQN